jgi:hypothetical protein
LIVGTVALTGTAAAQAKGSATPYPLPISKSNLHACRDGVLKLGHGSIERRWTRAHNGVTYYVFETRERDGTEWLIACDSNDGSIVKAVGLDGL